VHTKDASYSTVQASKPPCAEQPWLQGNPQQKEELETEKKGAITCRMMGRMFNSYPYTALTTYMIVILALGSA